MPSQNEWTCNDHQRKLLRGEHCPWCLAGALPHAEGVGNAELDVCLEHGTPKLKGSPCGPGCMTALEHTRKFPDGAPRGAKAVVDLEQELAQLQATVQQLQSSPASPAPTS